VVDLRDHPRASEICTSGRRAGIAIRAETLRRWADWAISRAEEDVSRSDAPPAIERATEVTVAKAAREAVADCGALRTCALRGGTLVVEILGLVCGPAFETIVAGIQAITIAHECVSFGCGCPACATCSGRGVAMVFVKIPILLAAIAKIPTNIPITTITHTVCPTLYVLATRSRSGIVRPVRLTVGSVSGLVAGGYKPVLQVALAPPSRRPCKRLAIRSRPAQALALAQTGVHVVAETCSLVRHEAALNPFVIAPRRRRR